MRFLESTFGAALVLSLTAGVQPIVAQVKGVHLGLEAEYVMLVGHWRTAPDDGPGIAGFAGYGGRIVTVRFGTSVSTHRERAVVTFGTGESDPVRTIRRTFFGEVGVRPSSGILVATRVGRMSEPYPGGWLVDGAIGLVLPFGPNPEFSVGAGLVQFTEENLPRTRYAGTLRFTTAVAFTLLH